jgi:hypothetical protein
MWTLVSDGEYEKQLTTNSTGYQPSIDDELPDLWRNTQHTEAGEAGSFAVPKAGVAWR